MPAIVVAVPLVLWLFVAPAPRLRLVVAALLLAVGALAVLLGHLLPRGRYELTLGAAVLATGIVLAGLSRDPRRPRSRKVAAILPVGLAVLACGAGGALLRPEPFHPPVRHILPLPGGLTVIEERETECGPGSCATYVDIAGRPGQGREDLAAELRNHLAAKGLPAGGCEPYGWVLDRRPLCTGVYGASANVGISLEGGRD